MKLCEHCGGRIAETLPPHMDVESNGWMLGVEVEGAWYCNQECADAVEFIPEPGIAIPAAMLDAATKAICKTLGHHSDYKPAYNQAGVFAQAALKAAGMPALLARIAELEAQLAERSTQ